MRLTAVERLARDLARRMTARRLIHGAIRGILVASALALALVVVDRLALPRIPDGSIDAWLALMILAGMASGALLHLRGRPGPTELLAVADRRKASRELLITAWELRGSAVRSSRFNEGIMARAESLAAAVDSSAVLPLRVPREARFALILTVALGLSPLVPKYVPAAVAREAEEREQVKAAGESMREETARLDREEAQPAAVQAEGAIDKALQLAESMAQGDLDRLTALERIGDVEEEIGKARRELDFQQVQGSFARAASRLEKEGLTGKLSRALSEMDAAALESELRALAGELDKPVELTAKEAGRIAEAFLRMSRALERHGKTALSALAREVAEALPDGRREEAAARIEKIASSQDLQELASDVKRSQELARALDASEETQEAVERLKRQDGKGAREALEKLASAVREGRRPGSYEEAQMKALASAMKALASDLSATDLKRLSESLAKAAEELERGDAKACARTLADIDPASVGQCTGIKRGDARLSELSKIVSEARALVGQASTDFQMSSAEGHGLSGRDVRDYGVGTSSDESLGQRQDAEHHDADRKGDSRSEWTEGYQKKYESLRLEGAVGSPTHLPSKVTGAADYVEFRGLPGKEEPSVTVGAAPAAYRKAAEDALSSEEIPPGYREQIKKYFDTPVPPPSAPESEGGKP